MPPSSNTPHHPLRRISTGSLSSLARSTDRANSSPSGLDFLLPALTDLSDEAATLATNTSQMTALHDALGTFNEAFAGYLYTLKMNAFCVEWPEAPNELSFQRAESLKEPIAPPPSVSAMPPTPQSRPSQSSSHSETQASANAADMTYMTTHSDNSMEQTPPARPKSRVGAGAGAGVKKAPTGAAGKKPTGALKKKRELEVSGIIDTLPLEYRGGNPVSIYQVTLISTNVL
ncbi:hypothetical protein I350_04183 [Cryptococcus amylolentus CBS 6273]|uniref:DASH complex subunit DAM1 n=1 Tax=Cryptococcus amylolentus CBS 6273 TaxID=1296118 RepID=A0A1E3K1B9_9TREE|nr:hypothetical protein I350_04183 [Cryptococcus amylolentus CBS 6273]